MALEKDQHPTARLARIICGVVIAAVTMVIMMLYAMFFDKFSETELVQLSFIWVSMMGFGIGGLILAHKGVGPAIGIGLVIALGFFLGLQIFFVTIWPSL